MKARLVLTVGRRKKGRPRSYTEYRVIVHGNSVGVIHRRRDMKRGKWPWAAGNGTKQASSAAAMRSAGF